MNSRYVSQTIAYLPPEGSLSLSLSKKADLYFKTRNPFSDPLPRPYVEPKKHSEKKKQPVTQGGGGCIPPKQWCNPNQVHCTLAIVGNGGALVADVQWGWLVPQPAFYGVRPIVPLVGPGYRALVGRHSFKDMATDFPKLETIKRKFLLSK